MLDGLKAAGLIYRVINSVNGRCYVGQTIRGLERRKKEHYVDFARGRTTPLYRAFGEYGWDSFEWETICECGSRQELNQQEREFIKRFDSIRNGYNVSNGGGSHNMTEETRRRMSEAKKGIPKSNQMRQRLSRAISGFRHHQYGKSRSDEERAKIRAALMGDKNPMKREENIVRHRLATRKFVGVGNPMFGKIYTDEEKKRMSRVCKGIPKSGEHRAKIREALCRYFERRKASVIQGKS